MMIVLHQLANTTRKCRSVLRISTGIAHRIFKIYQLLIQWNNRDGICILWGEWTDLIQIPASVPHLRLHNWLVCYSCTGNSPKLSTRYSRRSWYRSLGSRGTTRLGVKTSHWKLYNCSTNNWQSVYHWSSWYYHEWWVEESSLPNPPLKNPHKSTRNSSYNNKINSFFSALETP